MKTYISIGFCTILLGITFATFAAEEQMYHRESWQLQAEAWLQATHSKLGAQAALLATVGPDIIQKIARLLKPTGFIINNTEREIRRLNVASEKSFLQLQNYFDFQKEVENGNIQKIVVEENSISPHTKISFCARINPKFLKNPIFIFITLKKIMRTHYFDDIWHLDHVIVHANSNIYVEKRGGKLVLTISTPNEPLAFYNSNEGKLS